MTRRREVLFSLAVPILTIALLLGLMEIVLRFLPVSTGLGAVPVTAQNPVFHFTPDRPFVHSRGWDLHNVNRGRVNNAGFVNDQDYRRDATSPLLAVVGDSYIEALMVPYAETLQGRLARILNGEMRVYSFAAGGAPLSQYLIWARHAVQAYGARALIINVVGNDFDESVVRYKVGPGFWLYAPDAGNNFRLRLAEYRPGWGITVARQSALARYAIMNLEIYKAIFSLKAVGDLIFGGPAHGQPLYAGNTEARADAVRLNDSRAAIDAFFRDLPATVGLPPQSVLFTLDGFRYPDKVETGQGTYFDIMRRTFLEKAAALGYETVDLDQYFIPHYIRTRENFEFVDDNHWSGIGHGVATEAVLASRLMQRLRQ